MHGNITHFDPEKGCGVIRCDDPKIDVFLHINHVKGEKQLQVGDVVNFTGCVGPNGPEAKDVILLWKAEKKTTPPNPKIFKAQTILRHLPEKVMPTLPDDRAQCSHCRKLMIPKLALSNGAPERSFCPFCGEIHRDFTRPISPTMKERAGNAAAHGVFGLIIAMLFGL